LGPRDLFFSAGTNYAEDINPRQEATSVLVPTRPFCARFAGTPTSIFGTAGTNTLILDSWVGYGIVHAGSRPAQTPIKTAAVSAEMLHVWADGKWKTMCRDSFRANHEQTGN
jgi:hypothetical protein